MTGTGIAAHGIEKASLLNMAVAVVLYGYTGMVNCALVTPPNFMNLILLMPSAFDERDRRHARGTFGFGSYDMVHEP